MTAPLQEPIVEKTRIVFGSGPLIYEWPALLTSSYVREVHARAILRIMIDGILLVVGIVSFLLYAIVHFPQIALDLRSPLFLIESTHWTASLFWFSLLFDAWLCQRISRAQRTAIRVLSQQEEAAYAQKHRGVPLDLSACFDARAHFALGDALFFARRQKTQELTALHLFVVLFRTALIQRIAERIALDPAVLKKGIHAALATIPRGSGTRVTPDFYSLLFRAYRHAQEAHKPRVDVIDLFLATLDHETRAQELMEELNVSAKTIANVAAWFNEQKAFQRKRAQIASVASLRPRYDIDRAMTGRATPVLNRFAEDLTRLAQYGRLVFPVACEEMLDQLLFAVSATSKNIILVGPPGAGKTTLLNGIAYAMAGEQVPERLKDKRLMRISAGHIAASQNPPAVFQELLDEVLESGTIVLAITNLQDFTVSKSFSGFDLAEMLAETIERTGLIVFATSYPADYHRYIEPHIIATLFDRIDIQEPDENTTIRIVQSHIPFFEARFPVYFTYDAIEAAVQLSSRYLHDSSNPQKALDLCEQTAVALARGKKRIRVMPQDIAQTLEQQTHAKIGTIENEERTILLNLEDKIHERMINQETAVSAIANALRRARVELREKTRPVASFLFLGPTGVGKTELAKTLAEVYFGSEENMVRIDMSEYQDYSAIPRLIGTAGSDVRGGILTEAIRKTPFSLLLLDELEKATLDVRNLFLQVFEDGRLTDNTGEVIDFTNTIIIATSNAGSQYIQDALRAGTPTEEIKTGLLESELRHYYTPEFLNRFDDIIIFQPLTEEHIRQIARLMINNVRRQMNQKGILFEVTDAAIAELARSGFDPEFGARPLRRAIQQRVDDVLAKILLEQKVGRRDKIILDAGSSFRIEKVARFIKER